METTNDDLRSVIQSELDYVTSLRHKLHGIPETAFHEHQTSQLLQEELSKLGIAFKAGLACGTGIVAHIPATSGDHSGSIGLRADIDGLPIVEQSGKEYASTRAGFQHACGHDGHMAIAIGTARALLRLPHRPNPVTLLLQPAEEGGAGARYMIEDGALACDGMGPPVRCMFGLHGWPHMNVGQIGTCVGAITAATASIEIRVVGKQSHAGFPHLSVDPIVAAAHIVTALQSVVSRSVPPKETAVLTIGQINGGTAHNIIPGEVVMRGTVRAFTTEVQALVVGRMKDVVEGVAAGMGCSASVHVSNDGYPPTVNDAGLVRQFMAHTSDAMTVVTAEPFTGGEDFSFYGKVVPSLFFFLGLCPEGEEMPFLHAPDFDFNDDALSTGMLAMLKVAVSQYEI